MTGPPAGSNNTPSNITLNLLGSTTKSEPANTSQYVIRELLSRIVVEATNRLGSVIHYKTVANVTCTPASGSTFPIGNITVKCTSKDKSGNNSPEASFEEC